MGSAISAQLCELEISPNVMPSTSSMPTAARRLPRSAVAGERSRYTPYMKQKIVAV